MRKAKAAPKRLAITVNREPMDLTLDDFRGDERLCRGAMALMKSEPFGVMLAALVNTSPSHFQLAPDAGVEERAFLQAKNEGYMECIANLRSMGIFSQPETPMEATFEGE